MKKSKKYEKPSFEIIGVDMENGFLTGSITDCKVEVKSVKVQEFQDGFADEGGFKDITFD